MTELSIIIPGYNCQETLREAVDSVYRQNLVPGSFEIVIVDDASTDQTWTLMETLASEHPEIKIFQNPQNLGGGATRNKAVEKSNSEVIFCLDSDDILGDGALAKMLTLLEEKGADGVGISTSIKFRGRSRDNTAFTNHFGYVGEKIPFESLLEKKGRPSCSLYSTFMFTKKAFAVMGGYPINHGFDTQGFAWRFLANGLTAYTCPETIYHHRIGFGRSYYIREYESGKLSHNWFKVYEEFLFLFTEEIQYLLLNFNPNSQTVLNEALYREEKILRSDYQDFIEPGIVQKEIERVEAKQNPSPLELYWLGATKFWGNDFEQASKALSKAVSSGLNSPEAYYKLYDSLARKNNLSYQEIAGKISERYNYQKQGRLLPFPVRLWRKIKRELKKCF